ncbi:MAG: translation initiation factor [Chitinophagaceae bacterium]|nr:translation initiation factor [Chitinophagaceae bacterium]
MSKQKIFTGGIVYSTHSNLVQEESIEEVDTLAPSSQLLRVKLDTKQRAGKVVTLVEGFIGKEDDLIQLGKILKTKCGTGGSVKDGQIIVQGDYKLRVIELLKQLQYKVKS